MGVVSEDRLWEVDREIALVCGQLNALQGRLVDLFVEATGGEVPNGCQFTSLGGWIAWKTGSDPRHGHRLAKLVERADELPETLGRLRQGKVSVDQAGLIATLAPAWADAQLAQAAEVMTPRQLRRTIALFPHPDDHDPANDPTDPAPDPAPDPDAGRDPAQPDPAGPEPVGVRAGRASGWFDDHGRYHLTADLPVDQGLVVDAALRAAMDELWQHWRHEHPDHDPASGGSGSCRDHPHPTWAEALVRMAERSLDSDATRRPAHRRTKIHLHLDVASGITRGHLGPVLPAGISRLLSCDATYQAVYERDGTPIGVGHVRGIPDRLRTAVEHRDHGCRVPGCHARIVQLHHVQHFTRDHGETETWNLIALCPQHHRAHHLGRLRIHGTNADDPDGITFTDHRGRLLGAVSRPRPPTDSDPPPPGTDPYRHPLGERLHLDNISPQPPWQRHAS